MFMKTKCYILQLIIVIIACGCSYNECPIDLHWHNYYKKCCTNGFYLPEDDSIIAKFYEYVVSDKCSDPLLLAGYFFELPQERLAKLEPTIRRHINVQLSQVLLLRLHQGEDKLLYALRNDFSSGIITIAMLQMKPEMLTDEHIELLDAIGYKPPILQDITVEYLWRSKVHAKQLSSVLPLISLKGGMSNEEAESVTQHILSFKKRVFDYHMRELCSERWWHITEIGEMKDMIADLSGSFATIGREPYSFEKGEKGNELLSEYCLERMIRYKYQQQEYELDNAIETISKNPEGYKNEYIFNLMQNKECSIFSATAYVYASLIRKIRRITDVNTTLWGYYIFEKGSVVDMSDNIRLKRDLANSLYIAHFVRNGYKNVLINYDEVWKSYPIFKLSYTAEKTFETTSAKNEWEYILNYIIDGIDYKYIDVRRIDRSLNPYKFGDSND